MESYTTVLKAGIFEYEDRKSRFIAEASPVKTEAEALDFIAKIKKKYPDANHHVYAYVLKENSIMRFSDDREPQGTAGMPVLDAIRKNECVDTVIAVVRYFGGTLLGTGGLVRAYGGAAVGALKDAEIITYDLYTQYVLPFSYSDYQKLISVLDASEFRIKNTEYSDTVVVTGSIKSSESEAFERKITELSSGRCVPQNNGKIFEY